MGRLRLDLVLPEPGRGGSYVFCLYTLRCRERDEQHLASAHGIGCEIYYPPLHLQEAYARLTVRATPYASACEECLSIPVYPELTVEQVDRVASVLRAFEESHASPKAKETVA
jgi:dTDP-4-amino-4,6-dideoxygalactose transaminase